MCCPNRRLITVKEAGFKRYVGASYPKSLLFFPKTEGLRQYLRVCCPNKRLSTVKRAGLKAYFGTFCPNTLLVYFEDSRSKTCFESVLPE